MTQTKAIRKLEELYAQVPKLECIGKCQACCEPFRIGFREWERIKAVTGPLVVMDRKVCPMLDGQGCCSVHAIRPMLCRLWYTVENNPCPYGCKPDHWLTKEEAQHFLAKANKLSRNEFAGPEMDMRKLEQKVTALLDGIAWQ